MRRNPDALDGTEACDGHTIEGEAHLCPGIKAHCVAGEHCIFTEASCAAEWSHDNQAGHPYHCCICKTPFTSREIGPFA